MYIVFSLPSLLVVTTLAENAVLEFPFLDLLAEMACIAGFAFD